MAVSGTGHHPWLGAVFGSVVMAIIFAMIWGMVLHPVCFLPAVGLAILSARQGGRPRDDLLRVTDEAILASTTEMVGDRHEWHRYREAA